MHDSHNFTLQRKCQQFLFQWFQIMFFLTGGNHMDQDFSCSHTAAEKQMAQITCVLHLFIIGNITFQKVFMNTGKDLSHIFMNQLTVICCKHIISTAFFVQSQSQWTIFICISKRKLHFIAVSEFRRTSMNPLPMTGCTI